MISFPEYQASAWTTAIYPYKGQNILYPCLGLAGEVGELCNKVKKLQRDGDGDITPEFIKFAEQELGDILWYLAAVATELGLSLEAVARMNREKLHGRKQRDTLHGDGDVR